MMWDALEEIAAREGEAISDLVSRIDRRRLASGLTAAVRIFILTYYRAAATEQGHASAGHGRRPAYLPQASPRVRYA